jgi:hypothetical protein
MEALPGHAETGTEALLHRAGTHQGCESRQRHGREATQGSKSLDEEKMGEFESTIKCQSLSCHRTCLFFFFSILLPPP